MDERDAPTLAELGDADADADAPSRLGQFELGRRLGAGGMGIVFEARDTLLDRAVALKLLRPGATAGAVGRARLVREAQALARLSHPNVVTVFQVGVAGDQVFAAMELVDGSTLQEWMTAPHGWREIIDVFVAAGRGLAAMHALGLVHRDFKPSNVLLDRAGAPKVGDFGLVAVADGSPEPGESGESPSLGPDLTMPGTIMGTPAYMAPEQRAGDRTDARADQYSFCASLVEALAGRRPELAPLETQLAQVPPALRPILARGLAEDRAARYPSMAPLLAALARVRRGRARLLLAGGGIAAMLVTIAGAWTLGHTQPVSSASTCPPPDARIDPVWGRARKAALAARLVAIDPAHGDARFAAATRTIDPFVIGWRDMHVAACTSTRILGAQSDTLFDLRMRCLDRRLGELDASIAEVAASPDPAALADAVAILPRLTPLTDCADPTALARDDGSIPPALRDRVESLRRAIEQVAIAQRAHRLDGLLPRARALVDEARRVGHAPSLVAALVALANVALDSGDPAAGLAALRELTQVAARAHDDRAEAFGWITQISVVGFDEGRPDEGLTLVPAATAAVLRAGDPPQLRVDLLLRQSQVVSHGPHPEEALALLAESRRLLIEAGAARPGSPLAFRLPDVDRSTGFARLNEGDMDGAVTSLHAAITGYRALFGPDTVGEAIATHNLGEAARHAGRAADAIAAYREAARINQALGGETPRLASNLVGLAAAQGDQRAWPDALATYDRALAIYRRTIRPDDVALVPTMLGHAQALTHVGRLDEAAAAYGDVIALVEHAKATTENLPRAYTDRGELAILRGRCADAMPDFERATALVDAQEGPTSKAVIPSLLGLGRCLVVLGHGADAFAPLERAITIKPSLGQQYYVTESREWLGRALVETDRDRARGLALVRDARAEYVGDPDPDIVAELADLDRWLATHH